MIQLKINDNTEQAKALISYILTLSFVEISYTPNNETNEALEDAVNNKTINYSTTKDLFNKIKADAEL